MEQRFGEILSQLRRSKTLSQRALAKELQISQALLCQYENGTREPGLPFLCRVCDYFKISADFLLGRCNSKSESLSLPALRRFFAVLEAADNPDLSRLAKAYVCAASERVCANICANGGVPAAEQAAKMSETELALIRLLRNEYPHKNPESME